jgi:hypothetical protein
LSLEEIDTQVEMQKTKPAIDRTQNLSLQQAIANLASGDFSENDDD